MLQAGHKAKKARLGVPGVCVFVSDSVTPWTVAPQAPLSLGFSRQEHWRG